MPREGYVSVTLRRDTWEKLQKLKYFLGASTYDELIDKIYRILIESSVSSKSFETKIEDLAQQIYSLMKDIEKIYEVEKIIDSLSAELENVKTQLSRLMAKIEIMEKRGSIRK